MATTEIELPVTAVKIPVRSKSTQSLRSPLWARFFERCLLQRFSREKFEDAFARLYLQRPVDGRSLVYSLLSCQRNISFVADPLVISYLETFLNTDKADSGQLLYGLMLKSRHLDVYSITTLGLAHNSVKNCTDLETKIFALISTRIVNGKIPQKPAEARGIILAISKWLLAVSNPNGLIARGEDRHANEMCDALGILTISILENRKMAGVIDHACSLETRKALARAVNGFLLTWTQYPSPIQLENYPRLMESFKAREVLADKPIQISTATNADLAAAGKLDSVEDLPPSRPRGSTFVFLSNLTFARPITDDMLMMNFMQIKYRTNMQFDADSLAVDLIVGGFDLLSGAVSRKELDQTIFGLKSFLVNKIPYFISSTLAPLMTRGVTPEHCIEQANTHVDPHVFPSVSAGMISESPLSDVKQQFLFSCVLHSLLKPEKVEVLLGEQPFTPVPDRSSKLIKDTLFQECISDSERIGELSDTLEKLDGNAGAIALAITETIQHYSLAKDTTAVKNICSILSPKPRCLDVIMQFVNPSLILQPLCRLLDEWHYEDDQGEYQPAYEEFASIFLLVLVFVYRYELSPVDIGIQRDSFVARYLVEGNQAQPLESLSEEKKKLLAVWIKGLFNPDSITDEVLSSCLPQEFYFLVPTLFSQLLHVVNEGGMQIEALKVPLEYLLESFLVPSLVGAIEWMVHQAAKLRLFFQPISLVIFRLLTLMRTLNGAPQTVMSLSASPLIEMLFKIKTLQRAKAPQSSAQIDNLLGSLRPLQQFRLGQQTPQPEALKSVACKQGLKAAFDDLVSWSSSALIEITQKPPKWTPKILTICLVALGAEDAVKVLAREVHEQCVKAEGSGLDSMALDIATTMICAPTPGTRFSPTDWAHSDSLTRLGRLTMRDALKALYEDAPNIYQQEQGFAETVVRLYRRVEAQQTSTMNAVPDFPMPGGVVMEPDVATAAVVMDLAAGNTLDANLALDMAALSADPVSGMDLLGGLDTGSGLGTFGTSGGGVSEDDIFGDLMKSGGFDLEGFD